MKAQTFWVVELVEATYRQPFSTGAVYWNGHVREVLQPELTDDLAAAPKLADRRSAETVIRQLQPPPGYMLVPTEREEQP